MSSLSLQMKSSSNLSDVHITPREKLSKSKFFSEISKFTQQNEDLDSSNDSSQDVGTLVEKINEIFYTTNYIEFSNANETKEEIDLKSISIEDFEVIETLSEGGFGKVFLAKKKTTTDIFAIKKININYLEKKNCLKFIENEKKILNIVNNDYIVKCYYSFSDGDSIYFVMEYLNGGDLSHLLSKFQGLNEEVLYQLFST